MPRITLLADQPQDPAARALFDRVRAARGPTFELPNLYRTLAHAPALFEGWLDFAWPLRLNATTPRALRELLILRGAQVSGAKYEWVHHVPMAIDAGVTQEKINVLADWRDTEMFSSAERAVLRLAEEVTQGPGASAECILALRECGFDDAAVVELVLTASFYVCVSRFLQSMAVPLEEGFEEAAGVPPD